MTTAIDSEALLEAAVERLECTPDLLLTLFLFEKLDPEQRTWVCEHGRLERFEPGPVFTEGDPAEAFYVLIDGEVSMSRRVGPDDLEITRSSQRGAYMGATQAFVESPDTPPYANSVRALRRSVLFVMDAADVATMMNDWFPMAVHLLEGLFIGMRNTQQRVSERERLLALGSLSAGLTHELNNPAAAAVRATASLRDRVAHMRKKLSFIASGKMDPQSITTLIGLQDDAAERVAKAPNLGAIEAGDREDAIADWLDDHDFGNGYDIAANFAAGGLDVEWLEQVADVVPAESLGGAIGWLNYTVETELLMNEITDSTERISNLVGAAKQYSQLDRAPFREVDLHELLDSTLTMLGRKLEGLKVVKDYDRSLPQVPAYGAELNQVWTNLIDNAVQAMDGTGTLTIRTSRDERCAVVEVEDTGPGIPEEVQARIFEPFFTTKPVGQGTGLGLDISWRIVSHKHHGSLTVDSQPGRTVFRVELPLQAPVAPDALTVADHGDGDA